MARINQTPSISQMPLFNGNTQEFSGQSVSDNVILEILNIGVRVRVLIIERDSVQMMK